MFISSRDLLKLSEATAELYTPGGLRELPFRMLSVSRDLLRCDHLSYNEFGEGHFLTVPDPEISSDLEAAFLLFADNHPSLTYLQGKNSEEVVKISDFLPNQQWRRTPLYNEFFRVLGIQYQLAFLFRHGPIQIGFASNRSGKDFSERERLLLGYLLPHLRQAYENAATYDRVQCSMDQRGYGTVVLDRKGKVLYCSPRAKESIERFFGRIKDQYLPEEILSWARRVVDFGTIQSSASCLPLKKDRGEVQLTIRIFQNHEANEYTLTTDEQSTLLPSLIFRQHGLSQRETEVLSWIMQGKTNPEIAIILCISTKTVAHHVERILAKIGVEGRGGAAAWAQEMLLSERMNYTTLCSSRRISPCGEAPQC